MKKIPPILNFIQSIGKYKLIFFMASLAFSTVAKSQATCGPGPAWLESCTQGEDNIQTEAFVGIDLNAFDGLCEVDENIFFSGDIKIMRENAAQGSYAMGCPCCDTPNGPTNWFIDTEIIEMELTSGTGYILRAGMQSSGRESKGQIVQLTDNRYACSYFNVLFEIELPNGDRLYNQSPLLLEAIIDRVPPNAIYEHPLNICIDLYDAPTGGNVVAELVEARHLTGNIPTLSEWGLLVLCLILLAYSTIAIRRRQVLLAIAGTQLSVPKSNRYWDKALFTRNFLKLIPFAVLVLPLIYLIWGEVSIIDLLGTVVCIVVIAYWKQAIQLLNNKVY